MRRWDLIRQKNTRDAAKDIRNIVIETLEDGGFIETPESEPFIDKLMGKLESEIE